MKVTTAVSDNEVIVHFDDFEVYYYRTETDFINKMLMGIIVLSMLKGIIKEADGSQWFMYDEEDED